MRNRSSQFLRPTEGGVILDDRVPLDGRHIARPDEAIDKHGDGDDGWQQHEDGHELIAPEPGTPAMRCDR
jgi:hypothetical protein